MTSCSIRVGTVVKPGPDLATACTGLPEGFESYQLIWSLKNGGEVPELRSPAPAVVDAAECRGAVISALGVYGNPLEEGPRGAAARDGLERAIRAARAYGAEVVGCFAGRVPGRPVPESVPRFRQVFGKLAALAEDEGIRIALEHCLQGGNWMCGEINAAFHPAAWDLLFDAVPSPALGLEWEPCHLMCQMMDPLPVLDRYLPRIHHVHGKDGQLDREVLARSGTHGPEHAVRHRFPGLGDSDWREILRRLAAGGYRGTVDIEGFHDPVFRGEMEMVGQTNSLAYLKACRDAVMAKVIPAP